MESLTAEPRVATSSMIELIEVSKTYVLDEVKVMALAGVSLKIEPQTFTAIVGRSGSGKSTLLNILGGLDSPTAGEIVVDGRSLARRTSEELATYRRESIGFVFQAFYLVPHRSALENVALPLALAGVGRRQRTDRARELLDLVGLGKRAGHRPAQLSGGERQRVAIARALANDPKVLLADEPTGNLDSKTADAILELIGSTSQELKRTVILVTHDREQAQRFCQRVVELADGRVVRDVATGAGPGKIAPPAAIPVSTPVASPIVVRVAAPSVAPPGPPPGAPPAPAGPAPASEPEGGAA